MMYVKTTQFHLGIVTVCLVAILLSGTPASKANYLPADLTADHTIGVGDLAVIAEHWLECNIPLPLQNNPDFDGDDCVNLKDLSIFSKYWDICEDSDCTNAMQTPSGTRTFNVALDGTVAKELYESYVGVDAEDFAFGANFNWLLDPNGGRDAFSEFCKNVGMRLLRFGQMGRYNFRGPLQTHRMLRAYFNDPSWPFPAWWFAPEDYYSFCREHDIRVINMFDARVFFNNTTWEAKDFRNQPHLYTDAANEQAAAIQWVFDNGFDDVVVGWEIGNEPYFGWDPAEYADYVKKVITKTKAVDPDIRLGMSGFICVRNCVQASCVSHWINSSSPQVDNPEWQQYHDWLQWTRGTIESLGPHAADLYWGVAHIYGGSSNYNANYKGIHTHNLLFKAFPNTEHMRLITTEWRHSGSGVYLHRKFSFAALWKAKVALLQMAYPDMDYSGVHSLLAAGLLYYSDGTRWPIQQNENGVVLLDTTGDGNPRIDMGPFGPVMYMCNTLIDTHPYLLSAGADLGNLSSSTNYYSNQQSDVQWFIATNASRNSMAGIFVNTHSQPVNVVISPNEGIAMTHLAELTTLTCDPAKIEIPEVPGEEKWWYFNSSAPQKPYVTLPPHSVSKVVIPVKR